jgi:predicted alpha/beta-fold hydrolase
MKRSVLGLFLVLFLAMPFIGWGYDYPLKDPLVSTIIGTPSELEAKLPEKIDYKLMALKVFPDRVPPDVFWYQREFRYSLTYQKEKAPLVFVIAGTGASFYTSKMQFLQKVFYQAGFHVVCLSSPTQMNFIVTASESSVPGNTSEDARDLYRVMGLVWGQIKGQIQVSEFYLTGYSLGAAQAAFVAKLDDEKHVFDFKKVYMINPPVSLYNSAKIFDDMLINSLPGGPDKFDDFFKETMAKFSEVYRIMGHVDFTSDYLYQVYEKVAREKVDRKRLAAVIGTSFRLSSSDMLFTSDVMSQSGVIVPKNLVLSSSDSLTDYVKVAGRTSFMDYFEELYYPYFRSKDPSLTREKSIESLSLKSIEPYLREAKKIAVVTNEDELILAPGEVDFFRRVFGARAKIYPNGGHCGNINYKENVEHMMNFFKN